MIGRGEGARGGAAAASTAIARRAASLLAALLFGAAVSTSALGLGCARARDGGAPPSSAEDAGAPVDVAVMAYLSEARALHHQANVHEADGELSAAIAPLERLVGAARPHPNEPVPEVDEVLADTHARLADLRLRAGDVDGAAREVRAGMAHAPGPTYFRGHLLEVGGIVEEARAASLADAGRGDEAARARAGAIDLLRQAVDVQEKVIEASLDGGAPAPGEREGGAR